jgi:hypothetical protein
VISLLFFLTTKCFCGWQVDCDQLPILYFKGGMDIVQQDEGAIFSDREKRCASIILLYLGYN